LIAVRAAALALVIAACGGSSGPAAPPPAPRVIATPPASADDLEVARVNGHPVWGSCVAAQAAVIAAGKPLPPDPLRAAALDQCIAFELLAQAADARGLTAAPEVGPAARAAAVDRLIATEFEQRYHSPADLKPAVDAVMQRNAWRMHILQLRASSYARFVVAKGAPPDTDARAHALADRLAAELAGQTGLFGVDLSDAATRIAAGSDVKLDTADVRPMHHDDLVASYAKALYGLPEIGRSSPATRTDWGWDVIVWTGGVEAKERTRDDVVADLFPEIRRHQFQLWVTQIVKQLGVHIEIDQAQVAKLDTQEAP
jgi:hypothetical protein